MDCPRGALGRVTTTRSSHEVRSLVRTDEGQFSETKAGEIDTRLGTNLANDARHERSKPVGTHRIRTDALVPTRLIAFATGQALVELETHIVAKTAVIDLRTRRQNGASGTAIYVVATATCIVTNGKTNASRSSGRTRRSAHSARSAGSRGCTR